MNSNYKHLYTDEYFKNRDLQDERRLRSFLLEKKFIKKHVWGGRVCDVGCSTGEFLRYIEWNGEQYGIEINDHARQCALKRNIAFDKDITNTENFFDVVIFRGTLQHLPYPFLYIEKAFYALKRGGFIVFLATPNANSIYYKLFNTLPMLDPAKNFYIPSDVTLSNILRNVGFEIAEIEYPYLRSPYGQPIRDHLKFIKKLFLKTDDKFSFWKNSMNLIARKPETKIP